MPDFRHYFADIFIFDFDIFAFAVSPMPQAACAAISFFVPPFAHFDLISAACRLHAAAFSLITRFRFSSFFFARCLSLAIISPIFHFIDIIFIAFIFRH
jgi:hypothetical protein